jgi:hypothetical protein
LNRVSFLSEATDVPTKTNYSAKSQGEYLNLQAENTTDFHSISNDDMDRQSVNDENPDYCEVLCLKTVVLEVIALQRVTV